MTSLISASPIATGQVQSLDSFRAHSLPSDAMILASATQVLPANQNPGSYALVESGTGSFGSTIGGSVPVVTQSPFADLYKEGSIYFNGTVGNYVTNTAPFASVSTLNWASTGITIEAWVNYTTFTNASASYNPGSGQVLQIPYLLSYGNPVTGSNQLSFGSNVSGNFTFYYVSSGLVQSVMAQTSLSANTWNHIAVSVAPSGFIYLFVNGVQSQVVANRNGTLQPAGYYETVQTPVLAAAQPLAIGQNNNTNPQNVYLTDLRITTGAGLYTGSTSSYATFTVPSAPLGIAASGTTQFLLRAGQNSPTIQNGALTFDRGLRQYMDFGPMTFNWATRGFTCVFRYTWNGTSAAYDRILSFSNANNSSTMSGLVVCRANLTNALAIYYYTGTPPPLNLLNTTTILTQGTTYIITFTYNPSVASGTGTFWVNGAFNSSATGLNSTIASDLLCTYTRVGGNQNGTENTSASMNTFAVYNRVLSNTEIYNSYLALTTTPVGRTIEIGDVNGVPALSVAGDGKVSVQTVGLTSNVLPWPPAAMTGYDTVINGGVYKARASNEFNSSYPAWYGFDKNTSNRWAGQSGQYNNVIPYQYVGGNPPLTTDVNGTIFKGDWLQIQLASSVLLSSYQIYYDNVNSNPGQFWILGSRDGVNWTLVDSRNQTQPGSSGYITFTLASVPSQSFSYWRIVVGSCTNANGTVNLNEWTLYGTADTSPALTIAPATTFATSVATPALTGVTGTNYVPQDFSSSGLNIPAYVVSNTATTANTVQYSSFGPFAGEGSLYFPGGTGQYVGFGQPAQLSYNWTSYDFTIECFGVLLTTPINDQRIFAMDYEQLFHITTNNTLRFYRAGVTGPTSGLFIGGVVPLNQWSHLAVSWSQSAQTMYISVNGSVTAVALTAGTPTYTGTRNIVMGQWSGVLGYLNMYIANLRFVRGAALYTSNFTPPTGPLQPIQGTTQAGRPYGTVLLLRNAPAPGRVLTQKFSGANSLGPSGSAAVFVFPPAAMTTYATTLNVGYGQGTYVASASSDSGGAAWQGFDGTGTGTTWTTASSLYTSGVPYSGSTVTVDVTGTSYRGEWLQILLPVSIVLSSYSLTPNGQSLWYVLGSRDGINWFLVDQRNTTTTVGIGASYTVTSSQSFSFFRMVVNVVQGVTTASLYEFFPNGSIESINVTLDGRVGLGVVAPTRALEVAGDVVVGGTMSASVIGAIVTNSVYGGSSPFYTIRSAMPSLGIWGSWTTNAIGNYAQNTTGATQLYYYVEGVINNNYIGGAPLQIAYSYYYGPSGTNGGNIVTAPLWTIGSRGLSSTVQNNPLLYPFVGGIVYAFTFRAYDTVNNIGPLSCSGTFYNPPSVSGGVIGPGLAGIQVNLANNPTGLGALSLYLQSVSTVITQGQSYYSYSVNIYDTVNSFTNFKNNANWILQISAVPIGF